MAASVLNAVFESPMTHSVHVARYAFAESAIVTSAAPSMMASFSTRRPGPARNGKPCVVSPTAGTHASGVVTRNESVVSDISATHRAPDGGDLWQPRMHREHQPEQHNHEPECWAKGYVPFASCYARLAGTTAPSRFMCAR
jgi:hypothetical protein